MSSDDEEDGHAAKLREDNPRRRSEEDLTDEDYFGESSSFKTGIHSTKLISDSTMSCGTHVEDSLNHKLTYTRVHSTEDVM